MLHMSRKVGGQPQVLCKVELDKGNSVFDLRHFARHSFYGKIYRSFVCIGNANNVRNNGNDSFGDTIIIIFDLEVRNWEMRMSKYRAKKLSSPVIKDILHASPHQP